MKNKKNFNKDDIRCQTNRESLNTTNDGLVTGHERSENGSKLFSIDGKYSVVQAEPIRRMFKTVRNAYSRWGIDISWRDVMFPVMETSSPCSPALVYFMNVVIDHAKSTKSHQYAGRWFLRWTREEGQWWHTVGPFIRDFQDHASVTKSRSD